MCSSDREIVRQVLGGNHHAAEELAVRWLPRLRGWIARRVPSAEVDDYVQDAWLKLSEDAFRALGNWRGCYENPHPRQSSLASYLFRFVNNRVTDIWRRSRAHTSYSDDLSLSEDTTSSMYDQVEMNYYLVQLTRVIESYAERDQRLLTLSGLGHTYASIGEELGMTSNNVGVRLNYLRRQVREQMSEHVPGVFDNV